jgi:hypothetical protein
MVENGFKRAIFAPALARLGERRRFIQVLAGPRQVGKTTLAHQLAAALDTPSLYASADEAPGFDRGWLEGRGTAGRARGRGRRSASHPPAARYSRSKSQAADAKDPSLALRRSSTATQARHPSLSEPKACPSMSSSRTPQRAGSRPEAHAVEDPLRLLVEAEAAQALLRKDLSMCADERNRVHAPRLAVVVVVASSEGEVEMIDAVRGA